MTNLSVRWMVGRQCESNGVYSCAAFSQLPQRGSAQRCASDKNNRGREGCTKSPSCCTTFTWVTHPFTDRLFSGCTEWEAATRQNSDTRACWTAFTDTREVVQNA